MNLTARFLAASLAFLWLPAPSRVADFHPDNELIVCGTDEVFILDVERPAAGKLWSWKAANHPELPEAMRGKFDTTSECKPVEDGTRILITSSGDGVALVERSSGQVVFWGTAPNAHSAEILPGRSLVVAASAAPGQHGDCLVLFDLAKPDAPVFQTSFPMAHGLVWDAASGLLWALGGNRLRSYRLVDWSTPRPRLVQSAEYRLPDSDGHDLRPMPGTDLLVLTTERHVWIFDPEQRTFLPHPQLGEETNVKCVDVNPATQRILWTQAEKGDWWTDQLRLLHPKQTIELPGEHIYKARWLSVVSAADPR